MLPARHQSASPDFLSTKLSVAAGNWLRYEEYWRQRSFYSYGVSGKQIRTNTFAPFTTPKPDKYELVTHRDTGEPIPGQYVFRREPMTGEQIKAFARLEEDEQRRVLDNHPLTEHAEQKFDRMSTAHQLELITRIDRDNELHADMAVTLSPESLATMKSHKDYDVYATTPDEWKRSLLYHRMLVDIHKFGDAATKFYRTSQLIQAKHDPLTQSFDVWIEWLTEAFTQFRADFESTDPTHKDHFHCGEFHSFLLLHGTDRAQFRPVYEEQLRANPTGRFPDTPGLIRLFRDYHRSQVMSVDSVSQQGSSFLSSTAYPTAGASSLPQALPAAEDKKKQQKPACPYCKASGDPIPRRGHDPNSCSHNPNKLSSTQAKFSAARAKPPSAHAATVTPTSSADSDRLDRIESTLVSLAAIMAPLTSELEEVA